MHYLILVSQSATNFIGLNSHKTGMRQHSLGRDKTLSFLNYLSTQEFEILDTFEHMQNLNAMIKTFRYYSYDLKKIVQLEIEMEMGHSAI